MGNVEGEKRKQRGGGGERKEWRTGRESNGWKFLGFEDIREGNEHLIKVYLG